MFKGEVSHPYLVQSHLDGSAVAYCLCSTLALVLLATTCGAGAAAELLVYQLWSADGSHLNVNIVQYSTSLLCGIHRIHARLPFANQVVKLPIILWYTQFSAVTLHLTANTRIAIADVVAVADVVVVSYTLIHVSEVYRWSMV